MDSGGPDDTDVERRVSGRVDGEGSDAVFRTKPNGSGTIVVGCRPVDRRRAMEAVR